MRYSLPQTPQKRKENWKSLEGKSHSLNQSERRTISSLPVSNWLNSSKACGWPHFISILGFCFWGHTILDLCSGEYIRVLEIESRWAAWKASALPIILSISPVFFFLCFLYRTQKFGFFALFLAQETTRCQESSPGWLQYAKQALNPLNGLGLLFDLLTPSCPTSFPWNITKTRRSRHFWFWCSPEVTLLHLTPLAWLYCLVGNK